MKSFTSIGNQDEERVADNVMKSFGTSDDDLVKGKVKAHTRTTKSGKIVPVKEYVKMGYIHEGPNAEHQHVHEFHKEDDKGRNHFVHVDTKKNEMHHTMWSKDMGKKLHHRVGVGETKEEMHEHLRDSERKINGDDNVKKMSKEEVTKLKKEFYRIPESKAWDEKVDEVFTKFDVYHFEDLLREKPEEAKKLINAGKEGNGADKKKNKVKKN